MRKTNLNEELIAPALEVFECLRHIDVKHENTRVGTTVEGYTEALEALLTSRIPDLNRETDKNMRPRSPATRRMRNTLARAQHKHAMP